MLVNVEGCGIMLINVENCGIVLIGGLVFAVGSEGIVSVSD